MSADMSVGHGVAAWIVTYSIHSTLLIGAVWLASRWLRQRPRLLDSLWKLALVGGLLTASLQLGLGVAPWGGQLALSRATPTAGAAESPGGDLRAVPVPPVPLAALPVSTASPEPPAGAGSTTPSASIDSWSGSSTSTGWPTALLAAWLTVAALLLLQLLWGWSRLRRRLATGRRDVTGEMRQALDDLCLTAPVRPSVRLTASPALGAPIALGVWRGEICVPPRAATDLPSDCQRSLLAHELAHLVRRDPAWRLLGGILERLFFFQPLNRLVNRRLAGCSEYLCDDWAASRDVRPLALARTLAEVAGWVVVVPEPGPVATMGARPSELRRRVERLVEPRRTENTMRRWNVVLIAVLALVVVGAPGASRGGPAPADEPVPPAPPTPAMVAQAPSPPDLPDPVSPPAQPAAPAAPAAPSAPPPPIGPDPVKIARTIRLSLKGAPSAAKLRRIVHRALKGVPSAAKLREIVRKAMKGVPPAAKLRRIVRKALEGVPSAAKLREIVRRAMKGVPSAAKLREIVRKAMKGVPSAARLREMIRSSMKGIGHGPHSAKARKAIRQALEVLKKLKIGHIVRTSVGSALEAIKSVKGIKGIVRNALQGIPSVGKISGIVNDALSSVGNIGNIVKGALESIPSISKIVDGAVRSATRAARRAKKK